MPPYGYMINRYYYDKCTASCHLTVTGTMPYDSYQRTTKLTSQPVEGKGLCLKFFQQLIHHIYLPCLLVLQVPTLFTDLVCTPSISSHPKLP